MQNATDQLEIYKYCPNCKYALISQTIENEEVKKCNNCGFIFWNKSKPVVSILIHDNGEILMLQRANEPFKNYWVLPGGFIKLKETAEIAIKREAKEETGLDINIERIIGTYLIDDDPRGTHLDIIFSGTVKGGILLSQEDKKWQYFSTNALPEKIAYKHRDAINDWADNRDQHQ